jgi:hypothetical protein
MTSRVDVLLKGNAVMWSLLFEQLQKTGCAILERGDEHE